MRLPWFSVTLGACLIATAASAAAAALVVDEATQKRLGVVTAPAIAGRRSGAMTGFARVMDPIPLATLDADLAAAAAAASASNAEAARSQALFAADATVSAKALQAAQAQARADDSKVTLLRRRLGLEWGPAFRRMSDAVRSTLVNRLASGQAALIRIDIPGAVSSPPRTVDIDLGAAGTAHAVVVGPARTTDARVQSAGWVAQVTGPMALRLNPGLVAPVTVATSAGAPGVVVPRTAILRTGGATLVFVRKAADRFERRVVSGVVGDATGLFVSNGLAPGDLVVTQGASALLAAQSQPAVEK